MKFSKVIPAVAAPGREGLDLAAVRLDGPGGYRWLLTAIGGGSAVLEIGKEEGSFIFAYGTAHVRSVGEAPGRAFVEAVADWLGLELSEGGALEEHEVTREPTCSWVRLGDGSDVLGSRWTGFKLVLGLGDRGAEVFFRVSDDGTRAQLVEKWSEYRRDLVDILERALTQSRPRVATARKASASPTQADARSFGVEGALDLDLPTGWLLSEQPEGHYVLTDPDEEMKIELSHMRLPPLPPDAPDVVARTRAIVDASGHRDEASPIAMFERNGVTYAWSEYRFDSRDTKRLAAPPRPARGRWLIAANAWIQVLVTGCWWDVDRAAAERAWDYVIASLQLSGRIVQPAETRGDA